jgi:hypothetical protein
MQSDLRLLVTTCTQGRCVGDVLDANGAFEDR